MTDTTKQESITKKLQDQPLTIREHLDPDKHWIGETLAIPTQTEIASTVGSVSGPGDSPFVARADHLHKLGTGVVTRANIATDVLPSGHNAIGTAATTSGTTPLIVNTLNIAAKAVNNGMFIYTAFLRIQKSVATDIFQIALDDSVGGVIAQYQTRGDTTYEWSALSGFKNTSAATNTRTVTMEVVRISGTGTATTIANSQNNNITAIFIPT